MGHIGKLVLVVLVTLFVVKIASRYSPMVGEYL